MAQILGFDEIEKIRSMPYDNFFDEMGITKEQKKERIEFAEKFEDDMRFLIMLILIMQETGQIETDKAAEQFEMRLLEWVALYVALDDEVKTYITDFCLSTAETTVNHITERYYVSEDRIRFVSENAALDFLNNADFQKARKANKQYKTWHTIMDGKERNTHHRENLTTIPIDSYFLVGDALMRYPHDMAVAYLHPEEVINCRCWVTYA